MIKAEKTGNKMKLTITRDSHDLICEFDEVLKAMYKVLDESVVKSAPFTAEDIAELCEKTGMSLPEEYFLKVPPEVENNYMASLKQRERVERLRGQGNKLSQKKQKFVDDGQLEFC